MKLNKFGIQKFSNTKTAQKSSVFISSDEDDEDFEFPKNSTTLGYFRKTQSCSLIEIPIDEEVKGPSYYRNVAQAIRDSGEGDIVRFFVNSPGGRLDGLMTLLSSIWKTDAVTEAHIEGFSDSAASMLIMHCDAVYVSPLASMLVHNTSYGTGYQKAADIRNQVEHYNNFSEKFFRETYDLFLNEEEIEKCLNGYQLYLDAESIMQRLKHKFEVLQERQAAEQEEELLELEEQLEEAKKNSRKKTRQVH